ncbi:PP2C family protein-serine/threonine phosphatase [Streptomyces sp. NPDC001480]|uniref:PP2C family protein-serine/threonine phosphatase n=1 Tax=Streptomyces sp. NPDC001480 TaxID=3364577 RepID=UPI003689D3D3
MTGGEGQGPAEGSTRSERFGEEFLGVLLDQGHELPPHQLGPLVARQIGRLDGRETSLFLQDYGQVWLVPLPGDGLAAGEPQPIDGSDAGRAFQEVRPVEVPQAGGVRVYLPLLDGGDQVGVILHVAMVDAMGHGLDAATMATVVIGAYRHARRISVGLSEIYTFMDRAVAEQFGPDHFVTAQMMRLNTATGRLQWVNAGHPAPVLIRGHRVVRRLEGPTTLPLGFGGHEPRISEVALTPGDRILCFTDGLIEERDLGGEEFGEEQLIGWVNRLEPTAQQIRTVARSLSHTLQRARGGITTDDATLLLIEWRGSATDDLALPE